jgi:ketosteroid isomerase-like protein
MKSIIIVSAVAALFAVAGQAEERLNSPGLSLQGTFDLYVRSIHERDLEALMSTVTSGPKMIFLTTSGRVIDTVEGYRRFHVEWFAEQGWTIDFKMIELREGVEYGYVLTKYRYAGKDPEGRAYESESYFTLIFHKQDDMWKVIQDQITPIRK